MNFNSTNDENERLLLKFQFAERTTTIAVIETLLAVILGFVGLVGNSLVGLAVYRSPRLKTKCNYCVTTLAGLDLTQTLVVLSLALPVLISGRWLFSDAVCQLGAITVVLGTGSIYIMMLIAINRYFIMIRTNFYRRFFTKKKTAITIAISLVLSCNFALSYTLQGLRYSFHPGKAVCTFDISKIPAGYGLPVVATNVTIPFFVIAWCYIQIYLAVRKHKVAHTRQETRFSARDIRVTKTLFVTVCAFIFCWTPFVVVDVITLWFGPYGLPRQVYLFYSIMTASSSVVNPLIYGAMNADFRDEFKRILDEFCCRRGVQPC